MYIKYQFVVRSEYIEIPTSDHSQITYTKIQLEMYNFRNMEYTCIISNKIRAEHIHKITILRRNHVCKQLIYQNSFKNRPLYIHKIGLNYIQFSKRLHCHSAT